MILQAFVSFLFGVVNCFYGWQLFRLVLALWGFVTGALVAVQLFGMTPDSPTALLPMMIGGVIGAMVFSLLYMVGIVLLGAVFGFVLAVALLGLVIELRAFTMLMIGLVGALVFGLLAWWLNKRIIFLITAFSGSASIVNAALLVLGYQTPVNDLLTTPPLPDATPVPQGIALLFTLIWLVLGGFGFMVQWGRVRR